MYRVFSSMARMVVCKQLANTGLRSDDDRQAFGLVADSPTSLQGIRAKEMLLIVDETSGVKDDIMTAAFSLTAGGGKRLLLGNPSSIREPYSAFYRSHQSQDWIKLQISASDSPNVQSGSLVVPGLIDRTYVKEVLDLYGEHSAEYRVRILGEFCEVAEGQMFSGELLAQSQARYPLTKAEGRLIIAVDPAGSSGTGDDSGFVVLRGNKVLAAFTLRGLTAEQDRAEIQKLIAEHRTRGSDDPQVVFDVGGEVGSNLYKALVPMTRAGSFSLSRIDFSNAPRNRTDYLDARAESYHVCGKKRACRARKTAPHSSSQAPMFPRRRGTIRTATNLSDPHARSVAPRGSSRSDFMSSA
jgi:hypothetical protein